MFFSAIVIIAGYFASIRLKKRISSLYSIIHHMQLLILTPLIGVTVGSEVRSFYNFIDFYLFNFNFLGQGVVFTSNNSIKPSTDFHQDNPYLIMIGLESASAFYNIGQLVFVLCMSLIVYLITNWFNTFIQNSKYEKVKVISQWIFDVLHFTYIIRLFLLSYTFVVLASFSEITLSNEDVDEGGSWTFALILFLTYVGITGSAFVLWLIQSRAQKENNANYYKRMREFFRGLKQGRLQKAWEFIWMARALLFVVFACLIKHDGRFWSLSCLLAIQISYVAFVAIFKPFKEWVDYVIELFNGIILAIHLFILFFLDKESRWDDGVDTTWLSLIIITAAINCFIIIGICQK